MATVTDATVLVVEDDESNRSEIARAIRDAGYSSLEVSSAEEALAALERETPDLILLGHDVGALAGPGLLSELRARDPDLPVILVTPHARALEVPEGIQGNIDGAVRVPFESGEPVRSVQRAFETSRLRALVAEHEESRLARLAGGRLVRDSTAMAAVHRTLQRVAQSGASTVLLLGESGVGKGFAARTLHGLGGDSRGPILAVSCPSRPKAELGSALFGHERGALPGAEARKRGRLELAEGGTLFLDEIGALPLSLQGELLRFLEDRTFRRSGGTRNLRAEVRLIASTNRDLEVEVREGRFRKDLYERLRVLAVRIPPLRQRREDIPALTDMFLARFNGELGRNITGVDGEVERAFMRYPWPGNVRELENAIEHAVLLGTGPLLRLEDMPHALQGRDLPPSRDALEAHLELPRDGVDLERLERHFVVQALDRTGGNRARAARLLGMNRDQMRYRIKKFKLSQFQVGDA